MNFLQQFLINTVARTIWNMLKLQAAPIEILVAGSPATGSNAVGVKVSTGLGKENGKALRAFLVIVEE